MTMLSLYNIPMKRCFIAIPFSESLQEILMLYIQRLKKNYSSPCLKYVRPESIHITMHFLGWIGEQVLETLDSLLKKATENETPFTLKTGLLGAFPSLNSPRVLYLSCKGGDIERAKTLQREIGKQLAQEGIPVEKRAWVPHITLARVKCPVNRFPHPHDAPESFDISVTKIVLMESRLQRSGARYSILKSYQFKKI